MTTRAGTQGFELVVSNEREGWSARAVRGVIRVDLTWVSRLSPGVARSAIALPTSRR